MPDPTVRFFRITAQGDNNLARLNLSGPAGPTGVQVGTGISSPDNVLAFGSAQAGAWAVPKVFVMDFTGGTISKLTLAVYDAVSNLEDFTAGTPWDFRLSLKTSWTDPAAISAGTIATWTALPLGTVDYFTVKDDETNNIPGTSNVGHDGSGNLVIAHASGGSRYVTNFYIYVTAKPQVNAASGLHLDWGIRANSLTP